VRKPTFLLASLLLCIFLSSHAFAATKNEVMASRYMKYNFCMEKVQGQDWRKRYKVPFGMNRWGVSEPTASGIANANQSIRGRDLHCRRENSIDQEPRPSVEYPEKNNSD
jgi:hypothetical protein